MKIALPLILSFVLLIYTPKILAASALELSTSADFSQTSTNFSAGQTIYVRVVTDNPGDNEKVLNIRDNQYNLLKTLQLSKSGNTFLLSFGAPGAEGYYSLETKITSALQNTTSVKTIKIGASGESVKVNVNSKVRGESVSLSNQDTSSEDESNESDKDLSQTPELSAKQSGSDSLGDTEFGTREQGFLAQIADFCKKVIDSIWPF